MQGSIIKKIKKHKSIIIWAFIIIVLGWTYVYLHPNEETLYCDEKLLCSVSKTYMGIIKTHGKIELGQNSTMQEKHTWASWSKRPPRSCSYKVYPIIIDKNSKQVSPFTYYYSGFDTSEQEAPNILEPEISQFNEYVKNPQRKFYMETTYGNILIIFTILATIFCFMMYYVFNFIELLIKKAFRFIKQIVIKLFKKK